MRSLRFKFRNLFFVVVIAILVIVAILYIILSIQKYEALHAGGVRQFNREWSEKFDPLRIGGDMPLEPQPEQMLMSRDVLATVKFYVNVVQSKLGCTLRYCDVEVAKIYTLGGWLEAEETQVTIDEAVGLDLKENQNVKSIVIIGNQKGKIVGIFPNKTINDVISILKFYPKLVDLDTLKGTDGFGSLKVGEIAPLKPGNSIENLSKKFIKFSLNKIPAEKQFYIYVLQNNKSNGNYFFCEPTIGCKYLEIADIIFDSIGKLNGWFLVNDNDNSKMAELFGFEQEDMLSGKSSLVVLTDSEGKIIALHPNKTLSDAITILSQHPDIVNLEGI